MGKAAIDPKSIHFAPWADFLTQGYSVPKGDEIQARAMSIMDADKRWNFVVLALSLYALCCYFSSGLLVLAVLVGVCSVPLFLDRDLNVGSLKIEPMHVFGLMGFVGVVTIWYTESMRPLIYALIFIGLALEVFCLFKGKGKGGGKAPGSKLKDKLDEKAKEL